MVELVFQEHELHSDPLAPPLLDPLQNKLENRDWVVEAFKEQRQSSFLHLLLRPFRADRRARRNRGEEEDNEPDHIKLITHLMRKKAPNLTINNPDAIPDPLYLWLCVAAGAILQCLVFFFNAYVAYRKRWLRAGARVASYGFPLWASGTLSIIVGLFMCAHVIENVTTEYIVKPKNSDDKFRVVGFQKPIPSMNLPAYVFLYKDSQVLVSQRTTFVGKRNIPDLDGISKDITADLFLQSKKHIALNMWKRGRVASSRAHQLIGRDGAR